MVDYRDSAILRMLVLEKLDANRLAGRDVSGIGDGERTGKSALSHQPTGEGGEPRPMRNSGKGPAVNAPAKFTGLRLVSSRCLDTANPTRARAAVSKHLMLVR